MAASDAVRGREAPSRGWLLSAAALSVTILGVAPFMGGLRDALFEAVPNAVEILGGLLAALGLALIAWVAWKVARQPARLRRRGVLLLVGVLALLWVQVQGFSIGIPSSDVVEKVHILEYGLLAFLLYRATRLRGGAADVATLLVPVLGAALVGLGDESVQGYFQVRVGDVRDVVLDVLAGLTGLLFALAVDPPAKWSPTPRRRRRAAAVLLFAALAGFVAFVGRFHVGHEIHDPEIGRFVSWFSAEELERLRADRARRWAADPPTELRPLAPEDYYLTEAARHAQHRNERLEAGDENAATQANRILERYYAPFLELESFRGSGRHRWPEEMRRRLEAKYPPAPEIYVSPVLQDRLWTRSDLRRDMQ